MPVTKITKSGEMIVPESLKPSPDKRGGYMVRFARTVIRGRNGSTVWKDVRFLNGKFEAWPKRWDDTFIKKFEAQVMRAIDENVEKLAKKETVLLREEVSRPEGLLRDVQALDRKMNTLP